MNATPFVLLATQKAAGDVYLFIITCGILCILCILSIMWANYRNQKMLESTNMLLGRVLDGYIAKNLALSKGLEGSEGQEGSESSFEEEQPEKRDSDTEEEEMITPSPLSIS